jgi:hypothetical protein
MLLLTAWGAALLFLLLIGSLRVLLALILIVSHKTTLLKIEIPCTPEMQSREQALWVIFYFSRAADGPPELLAFIFSIREDFSLAASLRH